MPRAYFYAILLVFAAVKKKAVKIYSAVAQIR